MIYTILWRMRMRETPAPSSGPADKAARPRRPRVAAASKAAQASTQRAAPAVPPPTPAPKGGKLKAKLVRDSFTMPQEDFNLIATLKGRATGFQRPAKKSELLRAGLHALLALDDKQLHRALENLVPLKPGRPKKDSPAVARE
jgi:hypothetical protein